MRKVSSVQLSAAIREAIGLTAEQKAFLWNIASSPHGEDFTDSSRLELQVGMSKAQLQRVSRALEHARLVSVEKRQDGTRNHRVRYAALEALAEPDRPWARAIRDHLRDLEAGDFSVNLTSTRARVREVAHRQSIKFSRDRS